MAAPGVPGWQAEILRGVNAPVTPANLTFLNAWTRAEGGAAANNPFNTTQPSPHATGNYNQVGVKEYATPQAGVAATVSTLLNGRYGNIIGALRQGTDAKAAAEALANSPWGTGSLVLKILGGTPTASVSAPATAPVQQPMRQSGPNIDALLAIAEGASPLTVLSKIGAAQPATPSAQAAAPTPVTPPAKTGVPKLTFVPGQISTRAGIQVNKQILPEVAQLTRMFGVKVNSGYRSPAHNAAVGGAQDSDHLTGDAVDFTGTAQQMRALYQWALGQHFAYVEPWAQAQNHVHISFLR